MAENSMDLGKAAALADILTCSPTVYTWRYGADGELLGSNSPEHVYHKIFEHTGCLDYFLGPGKAEHTPLILGAELGAMWIGAYEWEEDELVSCYVVGPVFYNEVDDDLLAAAIRRYHIDPAWKPSFVRAMKGIPIVSSILLFQYALMLHYVLTGEKISRSDLRFQQRLPEHRPVTGSRGNKNIKPLPHRTEPGAPWTGGRHDDGFQYARNN